MAAGALDAAIDPLVAEEVKDAVETPPHVREHDPVEQAFVVDALKIDLTPDTPDDDVQRA